MALNPALLRIFRGFAWLLVVLVEIRCAKQEAGNGFCHLEDFQSYCVAYTSGSGEAECQQVAGIYNQTACPTASQVLTCAVSSGTIHYYSTGTQAFTTGTATTDCQSKGGTATPQDGTTSSFQRCDKRTAGSQCISYTGSSWTSGVETVCTAGGDALASSCSATNLLGRCSVPNTANLEYVTFYYSDGGTPYTLGSAQTSCAGQPGGGTWISR